MIANKPEARERSMSDYDTDILLWSERQAELLRRRAAGELVNEAALDWPNIAEEIESVGNEQLHAVTSLLVQALTHDAEGGGVAAISARCRTGKPRRAGSAVMPPIAFAPSMRQRIDLAKLYRRALRGDCRRRSTVSRRCRCRTSAP